MKRLSERYSVDVRIGRGGVGDVYRGRQEALDRPVAIKLLRPEFTRNSGAVRRFEREARTTCRLHHPNVVTVFDVGISDDGTRFLVMELLEGSSLATVLQEKAPLPLDEALAIARQIIRGMGAGEGVGLIHRDLKPENIFLEAGNNIKILDFGLATLLDKRPSEELDLATIESGSTPSLSGRGVDSTDTFSLEDEGPATQKPAQITNIGAVMGTPRYMPPEQVLGWSIDHRSDLYSFGCILFELLTGRSPFSGTGPEDYMRQHLHDAPQDLRTLRPEISPGMAAIVARLLQKSPGERFQNWSSLAEALASETAAQEETRGALIAYPSGERDPLPTEPYRFLRPFSAASQTIFFGRDRDIERFRAAWEHIDRPRITFLTGASGVGKTSFLAAKVIPSLEHLGCRVHHVRGGATPLESLKARVIEATPDTSALGVALGPALSAALGASASLSELLLTEAEASGSVAVVLDQMEEVFTGGKTADQDALQAGIAALIGGTDPRIRLVLSVREDFLGALLRTLHPLPLDELSRTVALRGLEADDIREALAGPGRSNVAVRYRPFRFEPKLLDMIVGDLLADSAGAVAPRVQAVGSRLWDMVKDDPNPLITATHYVTRLGGAQGILARTLDEAVNDLDPDDRGIAKELLWALTHLPGSPTSRPAGESELVARAVDTDRRKSVLRRLEDRWRVVQGYTDPRWPEERSYRIAHESLITRIEQYSQEGTERNRARQLFHHGLALWLQGGRRDGDVLSEQHFGEIQSEIEDLVLRTTDERAFYDRCLSLRAEGWAARVQEARRRTLVRRINLALVPTVLLGVGFFLGQAPLGFATLHALRVRLGSSMGTTAMDLRAGSYHRAHFAGLDLVGARFDDAFLYDVDFSGAELERASFRNAALEATTFEAANLRGADFVGAALHDVGFHGADIRHATFGLDLAGGDFLGALFDKQTLFGGPPPKGAFGPEGDVAGITLEGLDFEHVNLQRLQGDGAVLTKAHLSSAFLEGASLRGAVLSAADLSHAEFGAALLSKAELVNANLEDGRFAAADLTGADLTGARLVGADLGHAHLDGSNLCGADLSGAKLEGASFTGAKACATTRWPSEPPRGIVWVEP